MQELLMFSALLIATLLAVSRVWRPWSSKPEGHVVRRLPMPWQARVEVLRAPLAILVIAFVVNLAFKWVDSWVPLVPLIGLVIGLLFPAEYVLTDRGVQIGKASFRRWTEFSGVSVRRGRLVFKNISGIRGVHLWLPGQFEDAEVVAEIRRLMRGAYTGVPVAASV
jgi:hypothetical protein